MKKIISIFLIFIILLTGCQNNNQSETVIKTEAKENSATGLVIVSNNVIENSVNENTDSNDTSFTNKQNSSKNTKSQSKSDNQNVSSPSTQDKQGITVTIAIECHTLLNNIDNIKPGYVNFIPKNGIVLNSSDIQVAANATVLDVLKQVCQEHNISLKIRDNSYVEEIAYLPEQILNSIYDGSSGWMYSVNGQYVKVGANKKTVNEGDVIRWMYSCSGGNDLTWS